MDCLPHQESHEGPEHYDTKRPWNILFDLAGSVWLPVLPYCLLNCGVTYLLYELRENTTTSSYDSFSKQGHGVMSLIVSYLVVSKVYYSLERFMYARTAVGHALASLRELNQLQLVFSQSIASHNIWRDETTMKITILLESTLDVLQDEKLVSFLARNNQEILRRRPSQPDLGESNAVLKPQDPLVLVQVLRAHIYHSKGLDRELHILERSKMLDVIHFFYESYNEALKLASTPLPFPFIQLGRTFLFLYTFTLPFALLSMGLLHESHLSVQLFVFFLTYGFVGLEFVSMKLLHPFGSKDPNDIQLEALGSATRRGMREDFQACCGTDSTGYHAPPLRHVNQNNTGEADVNEEDNFEGVNALSNAATTDDDGGGYFPMT